MACGLVPRPTTVSLAITVEDRKQVRYADKHNHMIPVLIMMFNIPPIYKHAQPYRIPKAFHAITKLSGEEGLELKTMRLIDLMVQVGAEDVSFNSAKKTFKRWSWEHKDADEAFQQWQQMLIDLLGPVSIQLAAQCLGLTQRERLSDDTTSYTVQMVQPSCSTDAGDLPDNTEIEILAKEMVDTSGGVNTAKILAELAERLEKFKNDGVSEQKASLSLDLHERNAGTVGELDHDLLLERYSADFASKQTATVPHVSELLLCLETVKISKHRYQDSSNEPDIEAFAAARCKAHAQWLRRYR